MQDQLIAINLKHFNNHFQNEPDAVYLAPGRINIIGEHIDYNDGYVLPAAIDKYVCFSIRKNNNMAIEILALDMDDSYTLNIDDELMPINKMWMNYLLGVLSEFKKRNITLPSFQLAFSSTIPMGAGLSSSAALECGFAFALNDLFELKLSKKDIALIGQQSEHNFAGVKCGIMDQFASVFGQKDKVIKLDCNTLDYEYYDADLGDYGLLLFDTCVKHTHLTSGYNDRRHEVEKGISIIKQHFPEVKYFRDCTANMVEQLKNELGETIYKRCHFVVEEISRVAIAANALNDKAFELEVITKFFDFIKEETHRYPSLRLKDLVERLALMQKEGIRLPLTISTGGIMGVNLLTTHGSKGLEFEYVFVAGTNAHFWEKKRASNNIGYTMPDTVLSSLENNNDKEELRRLFYVALTRAKKELQISFALHKADSKVAEPSQFVIELIEGNEKYIVEKQVDEAIKMEYKLLHIQTTVQPEIGQLENDFINPKVEKFTMNVTALNNYLKCPLHFYYNSLIRVPSGKSEATTFGSAVHDALNKLFKKMQERENKFPDKQELIQDFDYYMNRHREAFTQVEFNRRKEQGDIVLTKYYDQYVEQWNKVVTTEYRINNVVLNGIPLKGAIDKIEFNGKQVVVIDYKTGSVENAKEKLLAPNDKNPNGGDYWRQAVFYKILLNHHPKQWEVITAEFDFVEPNKKKEFEKVSISIADADITTVTQQINTTWKKIQEKDFYTGCGKPDCHWCNFVKNNELSVALHEISSQDLEESD